MNQDCNNRCNNTTFCWTPTVFVPSTALPITSALFEYVGPFPDAGDIIPFQQRTSSNFFTATSEGIIITGYNSYLLSYRILTQSTEATNITVTVLVDNTQVVSPGSISYNTTQIPGSPDQYLATGTNAFTLNTRSPNSDFLISILPTAFPAASATNVITINADLTIVGLS